jgi:ribosomal protein L37E
VTLIYHSQSIGQRAACNEAARLARSKYLMKLDAHCAVGQGFDRILLEDIQDDMTIVPTMYNLHVFDWVCKNGHRRYQGPTGPCTECGEPTEREYLWKAKKHPESTSMRFDKDLHFQYWAEYKKQQKGDLVETMSIIGCCFMLSKERWFELDICDEAHGSWGQQGTEVACKTWLSGGRLICDRRTWFAHLFRTQGGDFGFPYPNPGVEKARAYSRDLWLNDKWDKAIHPLSWLVEKFNPPDWNNS